LDFYFGRSIQTGTTTRAARGGMIRPDSVSGWYARLDRIESDRDVQMKQWLEAWKGSLDQGVPVAALLPEAWPTLPAALLADAGHVLDQLLARHDAQQDGRSPRGAHAIPIRLVDAIIGESVLCSPFKLKAREKKMNMTLDALPPGFRDRLNDFNINVGNGKAVEEFEEDELVMSEVRSGSRTMSGIPLPLADPACGAGVFAARVLKKHSDFWLYNSSLEKMSEDTETLLNGLQLLDIDPMAVKVCNNRLILEGVRLGLFGKGEGMLKISNAKRILKNVINCGDALQGSWPWANRPIVCYINPPWLRIKDRFRGHEDGSNLRKALGKNLRECLNKKGERRFSTMRGNVNLYRLFIERGLQILQENGRLRAVAPDSLLREQSSAPLRRLMVEDNVWNSLWCIEEGNQIYPGIAQGVLVVDISCNGSTEEIISVGPVQRKDLQPMEGGVSKEVPRISINRNRWMDWTRGTWAIPRLPRDPYERNRVLRVIDELAQRPRLSDPKNDLASEGIAARVRVGEIDQTSWSHSIKAWKKSKKSIPFVRGAHFYSDSEGKVEIRHPAFDAGVDHEQAMWDGALPDNPRPRLACQAIVNSHQNRRLRWAVMPEGCVLGNSVNHLQLPEGVERRLMNDHGSLEKGLQWICEQLNDPRLDAWAKAWAANNNVNNYELETLPVSFNGQVVASA